MSVFLETIVRKVKGHWRVALREGWRAKLLLFFFAISFLFALAPLTAYRNVKENTFLNNRDWLLMKTQYDLVMTGVREYEKGTQALAGERLNLGAWHGFHEVLYRAKIVPAEAEFRFFLAKGAHLTFVFDRSWQGWHGIRFSNHPKIASGYLIADGEGKFLEKVKFRPDGFAEEVWHRCRVRFDDGMVSVDLDGEQVFRGPVALTTEGWAGFKGSFSPVVVDDVSLRDIHGKWFKEDFSPHAQGGFGYLYRIAFLAAAVYLVLLITGTGVGFSVRTLVGWGCSLNLTLALCGVVFYLFQTFILSERYPLYNEKVKGLERQFAHDALKMVEDDIASKFTKEVPENTMRILFLGGSQTWGEGANERKDAYVNRIEDRLNERAVEGKQFQCINGGIRGGTSVELFEGFKHWLEWQPSIVVMELGFNDGILKEDEIKRNAGGILDICQEKGIPVLYALEALSVEAVPEEPWSFRVHRTLANAKGLPTFNMYTYINKRIDTGCLFWDQVHPTSYGHRLLADELYPKVVTRICKLVEMQRHGSEEPVQNAQP